MDTHDTATEIWSAAQLMPDEGIEDGVARIEEILRENYKGNLMDLDKLIHSIIMDLRTMAIQHPQTLEVSQAVIDRVYKIKAIVDHMEPIDEGSGGNFGRPVVKRIPPQCKSA